MVWQNYNSKKPSKEGQYHIRYGVHRSTFLGTMYYISHHRPNGRIFSINGRVDTTNRLISRKDSKTNLGGILSDDDGLSIKDGAWLEWLDESE